MAKTSKTCPLTKELCDPLDWTGKDSANLDCTFYIAPDQMMGHCLYIEAMKAIPRIFEGIKNIKISS